jgi:DNA damage-binding protein 1
LNEYNDEFLTIRHVTLEYEAACMDISLLDAGTEQASIAAVGLWTDISARILKLPSLEELNKESIGGGLTFLKNLSR